MNAIIFLESELLIDRTQVRDPHVRFLLKAVGHELAEGSAWIIVDQAVAAYFGLTRQSLATQAEAVAA